MPNGHPFHFNLVAAAHAAMIEHGFQPDFPAGADTELGAIQAHPETPAAPGAQDLRSLLWSSIDNDTSKDLDQIEWAEQLPDGRIRVLIGVADVDARVRLGTVIDGHAKSETTSVYTGVRVFPMLPAELSEGITSLNENEDRVALVIEFAVDQAGTAADGKAYRALVHNRAQLAYNGVGTWLEGKGPAPAKVAANADLAAQLKLQDTAAQRMVGGRSPISWTAAARMTNSPADSRAGIDVVSSGSRTRNPTSRRRDADCSRSRHWRIRQPLARSFGMRSG